MMMEAMLVLIGALGIGSFVASVKRLKIQVWLWEKRRSKNLVHFTKQLEEVGYTAESSKEMAEWIYGAENHL